MPASLALAAAIGAPLLAGLLALVWPRGAFVLTAIGTALIITATMALAFMVRHEGPVGMALGGWDAPLGIMLTADGLSVMFMLVSAAIMGVIGFYARSGFAPAAETRAGSAFWPLMLVLWASLNGIFLSRDLFNLYVCLELLSLSAVALVTLDGKPEAIAAALRYLLFALLGSLLYLLGAALIYAQHGALDIDTVATALAEPATSLAAAALMTAGLALKTALFPFHGWLPPAHSGAPAPASAMLSALVPKASFFIIIRIWFDMVPGQADARLTLGLGVLGGLAIVYGSVLAMAQSRLKLVIAYSTVAQIGYLFLVFPLAGGDTTAQPWSAGAWTGGMLHALSHALAKAAMFLCAGLFIVAARTDTLAAMRGLARSMPMTTFAFGLAAVTLMGLPPSGGFTAKYLMLTSAFASGQWAWGALILSGGLLAALYLYRPLKVVLTPPEPNGDAFAPVPRLIQTGPLALALAAIILGILSYEPYELLQIGRPVAAEAGLE